MQNENHKILGVIFLAEFAITILFAVFFLVLFGISFFMTALNASKTNGEGVLGLFIVYAIIFLLYGILMAGFGIGGWKLFKNKPGAVGWGVVASIFSIFFFFPLGFLISILGFILLFANFGNNNNRNFNNQQNYPPQPPQNWR
jgi:hypothetical protein